MSERDEITNAIRDILHELLTRYEERVPERGPFPDYKAGRKVYFGDPTTTLPGWLGLVIMNMDLRQDPGFDQVRFISIRIMKSREGGYASLTCLHGSKQELANELRGQLGDPEYLVNRATELAQGLPEETNPDVWK